MKISSKTDFTNEDPQTLITRAILLYPRLIVDICNINELQKKFVNLPHISGNKQKTFKELLDDPFWKLSPDSYFYHFLKLESVNDSKGLDKVLEIYVERSKILWKAPEIVLWIKRAIMFILEEVERRKFTEEYENFLSNLCSEGTVDFEIPFRLGRYENVFKGNFSDRVDRIDMNNIQDNQRVQPRPAGNPINL